MKDWLTTEMARNHERAELYTRMLRLAFPDKKQLQVMIGHHLTIMYEGKLETEDEIPSADTMMFDHDIMKAIFGDPHHKEVMAVLAVLPVDGGVRDKLLMSFLEGV